MSSVQAQLILYPAIIHSRVSKKTLLKTGLLEYSKNTIDYDFYSIWDSLDDLEKRDVLTIPHERTHFWDLTSFPIGMLIWRLNKIHTRFCEHALNIVKETGLEKTIKLPLDNWLREKGLDKIKAIYSAKKNRFTYSYVDLENWIINAKEVNEKFENDLMNNNDGHTNPDTILLYNKAFKYLHSFFGIKAKTIWRKSSKEYPMIPKDHVLALTLNEILEVRAYLREVHAANIFRDKSKLEWWINGIPSKRIRDFFEFVTSNYWEPRIIFNITALALSPAIDPVSYFGKKIKYQTLENEHPSLRLRRIFFDLQTKPELVNRTSAFIKQLDEDYDEEEDEIVWSELGERLFGFSTLPYSLIGGSRRSIMFGGEAQPVFVPFKDLMEHPSRSSMLINATAFNDLNILFDERAHNQRIQESFFINHFGMATPYLGVPKLASFTVPYCEIYKDEIHFFDSRISQLDINKPTVSNVILADLLSSLCSFSKDLFARSFFEHGQCWDFDEILDSLNVADLLGSNKFIRSNLIKLFGINLTNKIIFTLPSF